jgi:D-3-phosphoglycerate dehydrogenase
MMNNTEICVSATSFCKNPALRRELLYVFPQARFHEKKIDLTETELIEFIGPARCLICGTEKISDRVLASCSELRFISKYGVGIDNIDFESLKKRQVDFAFTPGINAFSVAELTLAFLLGLAHKVFENGFLLKNGSWRKEGGQLLQNKTVGIIGCGHVGSLVIKLLQPFNCQVLANDIIDKTELFQKTGATSVSKDDIYRQSDFISLHVPLTELTRNLIGKKELNMMNQNTCLVNTSRGEVIVQQELKTALQKGFIAGAAIDVFTIEPPDDSEFLALPNLMPTPHIGGSSKEARTAMGLAAIRQLEEWLNQQK